MNTVNKSSRKESKTESLMKPQSLQMCVSSYSPVQLSSTEDLRMWLQQAFPASHSVLQENKKDKTTNETCGLPLSMSFAQYDPDLPYLKTSQGCLLTNTPEPFSETWPKAGILDRGIFWERPTLAPPIDESESGLLPTITASGGGYNKSSPNAKERPTLTTMARKNLWPTPSVCGNHNRKGLSKTSGDGLATAVKMWPTPAARDYRAQHANESEAFEKRKNHSRGVNLCEELQRRGIGGQLNPNWVEWLMNWPIGWTSLKPLPMEQYDEWMRETLANVWFDSEKDIPRVADGVSNRVQRLKALGNGQVSLVVATAWRILTNG